MSKKFIASLTLAAFTSLAVPVYAVPQNGSSALVEKSWGEVHTSKGALGDGESVAFNETIKTGSESGVTLLLPSGSRYRVSPGSEFRLERTKKHDASLHLISGKVLASANGPLQVSTSQSDAIASSGEFVISANFDGADLQVLSGDARMLSLSGTVNYVNLPDTLDEALAFGNLGSHQTVAFTSEFDATADGPDRTQRPVRRTQNPPVDQQPQTRRVQGDEDLEKGLRPDQDIINPGQEPGSVVDNPPPTQPTNTAPASSSAGAAGGSSPWPWVIGGLAGLGALIALASNNEDDDAGFPNIDNINVPSPSFP